MKKKYIIPCMEQVRFLPEDIMSASPLGSDDEDKAEELEGYLNGSDIDID